MKTYATQNLACPFSLSTEDMAALAGLGRCQQIAKHEYVYQAGQVAAEVYLVQRGQVKVFHVSPVGREILLFFASTGDIFGLHEVLLGEGRLARHGCAKASEATTVSAVPAARFHAFLASHPKVAMYVIGALAVRLQETNEKMANLAGDSVVSRLARAILQLAEQYGYQTGKAALQLPVPLTQQELADMVGAARQTTSSAIYKMKMTGVISATRHYLRVENAEGLRCLAGISCDKSGQALLLETCGDRAVSRSRPLQ